jgi:hypothetical protein
MLACTHAVWRLPNGGMVLVVYPRSKYAGTNFGAAAFEVREIGDATTENECYELSINITATNFGNFDPGAVREFTTGNEQRVTNELTMILNSFRFLK